jgi:hypothetical protein
MQKQTIYDAMEEITGPHVRPSSPPFLVLNLPLSSPPLDLSFNTRRNPRGITSPHHTLVSIMAGPNTYLDHKHGCLYFYSSCRRSGWRSRSRCKHRVSSHFSLLMPALIQSQLPVHHFCHVLPPLVSVRFLPSSHSLGLHAKITQSPIYNGYMKASAKSSPDVFA